MMPARQEVLAYIASRIAEVRRAHTIRVAIDGVDAAGKTTLANELAPLIDALGHPVIRASIDGFHNPQATRHRRGSLSPEGYFYDSFNYAALIEALLQPLGPGGSGLFRRAVFDFRTDEPVVADAEMAPAEAVLLLDGVFLASARTSRLLRLLGVRSSRFCRHNTTGGTTRRDALWRRRPSATAVS